MGKDFGISRLCDAYGALLTEHRREMIREFYDNDLSLSEIAENFGITRQAVMSSIKQAEKQLAEYEAQLGMVARADKLERELGEALESLSQDVYSAKAKIEQIIAELQ